MRYQVSIERNGKQIVVGTLEGNDPDDTVFSYTLEYLSSNDPAPISISLPLQTTSFSPRQTKIFFDSLLPEGFTRRTVAQWIHADEEDYLTILHTLGCECLGALQITSEHEMQHPDYVLLSLDEIKALAAEGASKSAELVTESHLSLAGASGKVGLYYDGKNWYQPLGTAPSTHIVKQSHVRLKHIVQNEQLTLMTAKSCGVDVVNSFIINTGQWSDEEILLASGRYDRRIMQDKISVRELAVPLRLHQEDFAQALGIPASRKYEREGDGYLQKMFALMRRYSADPIQDMTRLWDRIVFSYLVGNTDAHLKNYSVLYSSDLKSVRLAPAYDMIGATIYPSASKELSVRIGRAARIEAVTETDFETAAKEAGIGVRMAMDRYHRLVHLFTPALRESAKKLVSEGYPEAEEISEKILQTGGIAYK